MSHVRLAFGLAVLVVVAALLAAARPASAVSPSIVISQVYGGGGNSGATLKQDYIELFNRGTSAVDVTGWSVQYASSTGSTWQKTTLAGTIQPGRYYLVGEASGAGGTVDLPTPDATGSIAMSATAGKVHLRSDDVLIATGTVCPTTSVDFIGYGSATNCSEMSPAPGLSNTTADLRGEDGCRETDNNSVDFIAGAPNPRNKDSAEHFCPDAAPFVASTDPANNAVEVPPSSNVSITFSEPVTVTVDWFTISCSLSGAHPATVDGGPTTFVLDPAADFSLGETCTVTVIATQVSDNDENDPPDTMAANHSFSFSATGIAARIHEIQGAAHLSPLAGLAVADVPGVVVARSSNGFWFQDPNPDTEPDTSEGLFVFSGTAPAVTVGDAVLVSGRVTEFRPGCSPSCAPTASGFDNLTTTELVSPRIRPAGPGVPIGPTVLGDGGRIPPATVIEDDAAAPPASVETSGAFDPAQDGIDFYESLEGMRVQINDAVAVGPRNDFGEIGVVGDGGAHAGVRTARGGVVISSNDFNPERIVLDDALRPTPSVDVSDRFAVVVGVMDYSFGNFKLQVTEPLTVVDGGLAREATVAQARDQLAVASFNVENLDPTDPPSKFAELAGLIVHNLRSPDIVGVQEVQDNDGPANTTETDATTTAALLIAAIEAAGGPAYEYRDIDPVDDQDGGEPGGNIRVGVLYNPERVRFIDKPGATSTTPNAVDAEQGAQLVYSPGRIDPTNPAFNNSRKPLAVEFKFGGKRVIVIVNHFNSKGGDDPLFGRFQPPVRSSEVQRHQQAAIVNGFVDQLLAASRHALVVVLGDLNDFEFSETLDILEGGGELVNLMDGLPKAERYSYVFDGNSQVLDQMLVSPRLASRSRPEYDVVHVNSEFADQASDHDPQVTRLLLR